MRNSKLDPGTDLTVSLVQDHEKAIVTVAGQDGSQALLEEQTFRVDGGFNEINVPECLTNLMVEINE